mgnify:CR=1 FL=1
MPDILAHYVLSYLVANRIVKPRYAVLFALTVLLSDVDIYALSENPQTA